MPQFDLFLFLLGCLGGVLPDVLRILKNRYKAALPNYLHGVNFWIGLVLLMAVGGLTSWILAAESAQAALIYGYASPQVLSNLAGSLMSGRVDRGVPDPNRPPGMSLPQWWAA